MVNPAEDIRARARRKMTAALFGALLLFTGTFGTAASATAAPLEEATLEPVAEAVTPEPESSLEDTEDTLDAAPDLEAQEISTPEPSAAIPTGEAIIKVQVGETRTSSSNGADLSGVELRLHKGDATGPQVDPLDAPWASCTSDTQGVCEFTVPETDFDSFWVLPADASKTTVEQGTDQHNGADEYPIYVGEELTAGETYMFRQRFQQEAEPANLQRTRSHPEPASVDNPELVCQRGLNIALVLDTSDNNANRNYLKPAAKNFVDQLEDTGTTLALYNMGSNAANNNGNNGKNLNLAPTAIDTPGSKQRILEHIESYTPGGSPDWQSTLWQVETDSTAQKYDLTVVLTGHDTNSSDEALAAANALKATGSRVLALGAGRGFSNGAENLQAISGPTAYTDASSAAMTDYALLSWNKLNSFMTSLAKDLECEQPPKAPEPSITITKHGWDTPNAENYETAQKLEPGARVISGKKITWTYEVRNTGETVLNDIQVVDDKLGSTEEISCPTTTLQVSETMTCTASGEVTADD